MKYNRRQRKLLQFCLLLAVLLLFQIVTLRAAEAPLNTTIERNSSPSVCLLPPPDTTIYVDICDGIPFHFHGHTYESDSTETIILPGQASGDGDSIIHLIVTEHSSPTVSISANPNHPICEGESITLTAECDCYTRDTSENFSKLSAYFFIHYSQNFGDICPYSDYPPIPGIGSCAGNAPGGESFELSNFPTNVIDIFPIRSNIYPAGHAIKLGKDDMTTPESTIGSITSIPLDLSNPFKIIITAKGWGEDPGKIIISVDGIPQQIYNTIHNDWGAGYLTYADTTLYFPAATNSSIITIQTDTIIKANGDITGYRAFINHIEIIRLCHYSWSTDIADTNAVITVQPENNTNYSVTVTSNYGCNASATYNVIVNHPHGTSNTIKACGSYTWHGETYTVSNTYYYTHPSPDENGCYPVDTLHLTINENPDVHISGNLNITEGHSTTLTAIPAGDQPYTYTWSSGTWSADSATNTLITEALSETTIYTVTVTDTNGCQGNDTATVNVTLCESWQLVTDASELAVGDKIVITAKDYEVGLGGQNNNYRISETIQKSADGNTIEDIGNAQILTLTSVFPFTFHTGTGYLYYSGNGNNNYLNENSSITNNSKWNISFTNNNFDTYVQIQNIGNTNYYIQYNHTFPRFSCYKNTQENLKIYKLSPLQGDTTATACVSFTWHGHTYTESNDYIDTLISMAGCDSVVTLHLTINPIATNSTTITVCEGENITLSADCTSPETIIFSEGFSAITIGNDINGSGSNEYYQCNLPNFPICDNQHVFKAGGNLRFGDVSTGGGGYITSIPMDLSQPFTVKLWVRGWNNASENPWFFLKVDNDTVMRQSVPVSDWDAPYVEYEYNSSTGATANSRITIGNTTLHQRFFLDSVAVVNRTECQYAWSTGESTANITITPATTTTYYVTVTPEGRCPRIDTFYVEVKPKPIITLDPCSGTCDSSSLMMNCQQGIILPAATPCASEYEFAGWSIEPVNASITTEPTPLYLNEEYYLSLTDDTLYAVYKKCTTISETKYKKVTSAPSNWSGEYLIVYENESASVAFDGGLQTLDAQYNTIPVAIFDDEIDANPTTNAAKFTISSNGSGYYSILSASGFFIGRNSSGNGMDTDNSAINNTISYNNGVVDIKGVGNPYLRYNNNEGQKRFRYYSSSTYTNQQAIQLYRKEETTITICIYESYPFYPSSSDTEEACDSYTWHRASAPDTTITNSGIYLHSHTETNGCIYVDTLYLTINRSIVVDTTVVACDSFSWHGNTYMWSGNYKDTLTNAAGCDSIITLHLSITEVNVSIIASADTICAGEVDTLWIERVSSIAIGDILCTDNSFVKPVDWEDAAAMGKVALGIVFYVDNTGEHGWAVHLHNSTSPKKWTHSSYYADIFSLFNYPNAREAIKDLDGYNNTQRIRTASNNTQYPADAYPAVYAVDFEHGWYLPAAGQLRLLFAERHTINASLEAVSHTQQGVTPIADTFQYWSSTECNRDEAWGVTNSLGWVRNTSKNEYNRTCSVRNF